jgi:hypothetical protein
MKKELKDQIESVVLNFLLEQNTAEIRSKLVNELNEMIESNYKFKDETTNE